MFQYLQTFSQGNIPHAKKHPYRQNGVPEIWVDDFAVCLHWAVSGLAAALVRKNHQQDMAGLQDPKGFDGITCQ